MITNLVPTTHSSTLCVGVCLAEQYCGVAKVIGQRFARECCCGLNNNPPRKRPLPQSVVLALCNTPLGAPPPRCVYLL